MLLDDGVGALLKALEAYKGEVALPTDPTRDITTWPPWVLVRGGKVAKYGSGCYSVAPVTR